MSVTDTLGCGCTLDFTREITQNFPHVNGTVPGCWRRPVPLVSAPRLSEFSYRFLHLSSVSGHTSSLSCCCSQLLEEKKLRGERVYPALWVKRYSAKMAGKAWRRALRTMVAHTASALREGRESAGTQLRSSFLFSLGPQLTARTCAHSGWVFPPVKLSCKYPHRHSEIDSKSRQVDSEN